MSNWKLYSGVAAAIMATAAIVAPAEAQVTSAGIRGDVVSPSGDVVPGATVRVIDTRTGAVNSSTTSATGQFQARGLNVGGPYTIEISAPGYQTTRITDVTLQLGEVANVEVAFAGTADAAGDDAEARMEVVTVSSTAGGLVQTAIGPSATFSLEDIEQAPAINRDLKDIVRLDPRVYLDESFNDSIQCAGSHPRFNSLTVDGIGLNDGFGLNSNGYPTQQMPFPFDAIQNVSVELAPFDVEYGSFTACNINAVTKSGTNEFHGSAFYDYGDDSMVGDKTEGNDYEASPFEEKRYGFTLGGPILKDRLFFFGAYEKYEGPGAEINRTPEGGSGQVVEGFTQAEFDEIAQIAQDVYGYNPGGIPTSTGTDDEKYLLRLDWNITNNHRASVTYNYNEGFSLSESDGDDNEFEFANHLYNRGAELKAYSGQLFSDWTDNFSTELRYSYNDVTFLQQSVAGTDFGEVQITDLNTEAVDGTNQRNTIYLGADDSRHSNQLEYSVANFKALGRYTYGDHNFTFGGERLEYDIFNLFVQESEGEFRFDSIDDFRNGLASRVIYENAAGTNNAVDGGASFKYEVNTLYAQDEWTGPNGLTVTAGLRYDFYTSDDKPNFNQDFQDTYGFANDETMDGRDLLMPRLGFTWDYQPNLSFRGGMGLYSGGNPNVWISNNYSNNGVTLYEANRFDYDLFANPVTADETGAGTPIFGIPQEMYDEVANGAVSGPVNALHPDFEIPSEWKYAFGFTYDFDTPYIGSGYRLDGDVLFSKVNEAPLVKAISLAQIDTAPDGRPIYNEDTDDFVLTNTDEGSTFVASFALSNAFDTDFGDFDWSLGYAYTDAEDVNPMTSSVAYSNWSNVSVVDPNNPGVATSNYEIPHRWTARVTWEKRFFGDYATRATLFGQAFQARPYSFTYSGASPFGDDTFGRSLVYVPTDGSSDPLVNYAASDIDWDAFFRYTDGYDLGRGSIAERNSGDGQWNNRFDLRLEQELPGALNGHKTKIYAVMENVGNFLNDDWGAYYQAGFPQDTEIVSAEIVDGQYVYSGFNDANPESKTNNLSVWTLRIGAKYQF
ncbi:TonB-dependent receptor [Henriciella aquimarina]|uniref:TonB-dependent receptor n=1 Tax=Henriciella aquimarina TaxID=545261 RepID=UPI000A009FDB|nr:TonB-dependent receptor [Henriciella aquimarina]